MSRTRDSATLSPKHGPIFEESELEHITQEQFNDELNKGLAEMLTQDQFDEEEGEEGTTGEAVGGDDKDDDDDDDEDDDDEDEEGHVKVPRILFHVKSDGSQQRRRWTRILTRMRRLG